MSKQQKQKVTKESEDISVIQQLKILSFQVSVKDNQMTELKETLDKTKEELISAQKENENLNQSIKLFLINENKMKKLNEKLERLEEENHHLTEELKRIRKEFKEEKENLIIEYEDKMNKLKQNLELMNTKLETVHNLERLSEKQINTIQELEGTIVVKDRTYREKLDQKNLKNSMRFYNLKQKMMEDVETAQKNVDQLNIDQIDISSKLTMLQNHQLLVEMEFQTQQYKELNKKCDFLEKQNFEILRDLEIHKLLEIKIVEKNRDLNRKIKELEGVISQHNGIGLEKINCNSENSCCYINTEFNSRNFDSEKIHKSKNNETTLNNTKTDNNINFEEKSIHKNILLDKKLSKLEKRLDKKLKENELLSMKYNNISERLEKFEKNFKQIINLVENGLSILSQEESIKNKNEILINYNLLKEFNFDELSKEKKYAILCILLKNFNTILDVDLLGKNEIKKAQSPFYNEVKFNFSKNSTIKENQFLKNSLLTTVKSPNSYFSIKKPSFKMDLPKIEKKSERSKIFSNLNIVSNYLQTD
jgi:hypothetical protein